VRISEKVREKKEAIAEARASEERQPEGVKRDLVNRSG